MQIPRYYYENDYRQFESFFLSQNPVHSHIKKGNILWSSGELLRTVYYIRSGFLETSVEHEDGYKKILSYHGSGTVFPGCHNTQYKIEQSLICRAVCDMEVLAFPREQFYQMQQENKELGAQVLEWYAMYINLLIYGYAHQDFNDAFTRLCNFLYIYIHHSPEKEHPLTLSLSQETLGELLGMNRVHISKILSRLKNEKVLITHRNHIEIINYEKLVSFCSKESLII